MFASAACRLVACLTEVYSSHYCHWILPWWPTTCFLFTFARCFLCRLVWVIAGLAKGWKKAASHDMDGPGGVFLRHWRLCMLSRLNDRLSNNDTLNVELAQGQPHCSLVHVLMNHHSVKQIRADIVRRFERVETESSDHFCEPRASNAVRETCSFRRAESPDSYTFCGPYACKTG